MLANLLNKQTIKPPCKSPYPYLPLIFLIALTILLPQHSQALQYQIEFENTNILKNDTNNSINNNSDNNTNHTINYNRLRLNASINPNNQQWLIRTLIDNENTYHTSSNTNHNDTSIYRAYWQHIGEQHLWIIGRQRVPLGVSKIFNPVDIFNPKNNTAIETSQITGIDAIHYEYAISDLANFQAIWSEKKLATRIKSYLNIADIALIALQDKEQNQTLLGYEIQGELLTTGIELSSEAIFSETNTTPYQQDNSTPYYQWTLATEYTFENSLNLLIEYLQHSQKQHNSLAASINYSPTPLSILNLLTLYNLQNHNPIHTLNFNYSLNDESSLTLGTIIHQPNTQSTNQPNSYFLTYFIHL